MHDGRAVITNGACGRRFSCLFQLLTTLRTQRNPDAWTFFYSKF